jgi:hypothetical protein
MNERLSSAHVPWRDFRRRYGPRFLAWLDTSGYRLTALRAIGEATVAFFREEILSDAAGRREVAERIINRIVPTAQNCDEVSYNDPPSVVAYAFQHLLERYRRTWQVLEELLRQKVLPYGACGVNVLDVGTGPAPTIYAIQDFYSALGAFAQEIGAPFEVTVRPTIAEPGRGMVAFMHRFSEFKGSLSDRFIAGPYSARFGDLLEICLPELRRRAIEDAVDQMLADDDDYGPRPPTRGALLMRAANWCDRFPIG